MKLLKKTERDAHTLNQPTSASGDKTLWVILALDALVLFWLINFDKVVLFLTWALGK